MKIARFLVTPDFLRELLSLPMTTEIVWAGMAHHQIELTVKDPGLPDVDLVEGERPPLVQPTFRKHYAELIAWNP